MVERLVEKAAGQLGLAPDEIRRRNLIPSAEMPYRVPLDITYDSGDYARNLDDGMALAGWSGFAGRRAEAQARGRLRGIGMAVYVESTIGDPAEHVSIRFRDDGGVSLSSGTGASGQGHETTYAQLLGESLGIPFEAVTLIEGDSDDLPAGGGTGGSRSTYMVALAIEDGAAKVIEKGTQVAANLLEVAPADIRFDDGSFAIAGTDRAIDIMELAARARDPANVPDGMEPGLDADGRTETFDGTFPNGCHICEVEVDPDTGAVDIVNYAAVNDFGRIVNPVLVDGQVHGGVAQGLGQAVFENCVYDEHSGQLLSGSFMDYCLPRADDLPDFALATNEVPTSQNPARHQGLRRGGVDSGAGSRGERRPRCPQGARRHRYRHAAHAGARVARYRNSLRISRSCPLRSTTSSPTCPTASSARPGRSASSPATSTPASATTPTAWGSAPGGCRNTHRRCSPTGSFATDPASSPCASRWRGPAISTGR